MYKYFGFGLNITSELAMPELMPANFDIADIIISRGNVPENIEGVVLKKGPFGLMGANEYILNIRNVSRYYAGYGKNIIVEACGTADEQSTRLFLLGTVMAAILYQRGDIPLHASAIEKKGKITLFTGASGAGKSTLLAHLSTKGYTVFTDDICVVRFDKANNTITGAASYPMMKLWEDTLQKIDHGSFSRDFKIRPQSPKYGQFFHETFYKETLPVEKVFILRPSKEQTEISHTLFNSIQAFTNIEKQAYRYRFTTGGTSRAVHFELMSALAKQIPIIEIKRPLSGTSIEDFSAIVETLM